MRVWMLIRHPNIVHNANTKKKKIRHPNIVHNANTQKTKPHDLIAQEKKNRAGIKKTTQTNRCWRSRGACRSRSRHAKRSSSPRLWTPRRRHGRRKRRREGHFRLFYYYKWNICKSVHFTTHFRPFYSHRWTNRLVLLTTS
jgi:hypothetical protein